MDTTVLGEQIQKFRKQRGMTQKELGAAVGVSTQAVSQWECGGAHIHLERIKDGAYLDPAA